MGCSESVIVIAMGRSFPKMIPKPRSGTGTRRSLTAKKPNKASPRPNAGSVVVTSTAGVSRRTTRKPWGGTARLLTRDTPKHKCVYGGVTNMVAVSRKTMPKP